jgi:hypothetical protein
MAELNPSMQGRRHYLGGCGEYRAKSLKTATIPGIKASLQRPIIDSISVSYDVEETRILIFKLRNCSCSSVEVKPRFNTNISPLFEKRINKFSLIYVRFAVWMAMSLKVAHLITGRHVV